MRGLSMKKGTMLGRSPSRRQRQLDTKNEKDDFPIGNAGIGEHPLSETEDEHKALSTVDREKKTYPRVSR
jgi:hypothetical protein